MQRPHHIIPAQATARVILAAKNFGANIGISHIGLGVTNLNNSKVLTRAGYFSEVWGTQCAAQLDKQILEASAHAIATGLLPISHVIINAPSWISPEEFDALVRKYPRIEFVMMNHTGCAYLSMDTNGIKNNRKLIELERSTHNFKVGGNNTRFVRWFRESFSSPCLLLPNLYDTQSFLTPYPIARDFGGALRVGGFGAARVWKNQLTAAEAAVQLSRRLGMNVELYVNRRKGGDDMKMIEARQDLFVNLRGVKLIEVGWESWPTFRQTCGHMHLLLQPSFDETFNVVTADGIAMGVPSVVGDCIEWVPQSWHAKTCDPSDLVAVALFLLNDQRAVEEGRDCLRKYVRDGLEHWKDYLGR